MKTPMQEVFDHLRASKETDSFGEVYCVDWLLENEKSFLEKEKDSMCQFQSDGQRTDFWVKYKDNDDCFDKTFNTKEND